MRTVRASALPSVASRIFCGCDSFEIGRFAAGSRSSSSSPSSPGASLGSTPDVNALSSPDSESAMYANSSSVSAVAGPPPPAPSERAISSHAARPGTRTLLRTASSTARSTVDMRARLFMYIPPMISGWRSSRCSFAAMISTSRAPTFSARVATVSSAIASFITSASNTLALSPAKPAKKSSTRGSSLPPSVPARSFSGSLLAVSRAAFAMLRSPSSDSW